MTSEVQPVRLTARVVGHVQGVGFRAFVQREAQRSGCTGYVRNANDGRTVEVLAEGMRHGLESLLAALHRGPRLARVVEVAANWSEATGEFATFEVR